MPADSSRSPLLRSLCDRGPAPRPPSRLNLAAHALFNGQEAVKPALVVAGPDGAAQDVWSYARLREAVARAAGGLIAAGLRPGDRVMLRLGDEPRFAILFLATIMAGGVVAPTSAMLTPGEAAALARRLSPRLICLGDGLALDGDNGDAVLAGAALRSLETAAPAAMADTGADDPAFVVFTSGSSGQPKGVVHAHRASWARRMMWTGWYGLTAGDRMLHAGAFNWTYTLGTGLLDPWGAGATAMVYSGAPDPAVWPRIAAAQRATLFAATPGVFRQTLRAGVGAGFASLRHGLTAGEALPGALRDAWTAQTDKPLFEALGMSELSTYVSAGPDAAPRDGWVGPPQAGRRVAVLTPGAAEPAPIGEEGELAVDAGDPGLMLGYWRDEAATAAMMREGWFVTGDRAAMAPDGYVAYRGRRDDLMNAGGYRVAPQEVEAALLTHPAVREAAVATRAVRRDVEVIAAYLVCDDPAPDDAALLAWCAPRLARYKTPRLFLRVDALPRTATGKVIRRALARL